jgi:hypothetical protein
VTAEQQHIKSIGGCGETSPDGKQICILAPGHDEPHPWDTPTSYDDLRLLLGWLEKLSPDLFPEDVNGALRRLYVAFNAIVTEDEIAALESLL